MMVARGAVVTLLVTACAAPALRSISYGADACAHCHMTVTEARSAAVLVTRKGRTITFDDPACLAAYIGEGHLPMEQVAAMRVNDFVHPDTALDARTAAYLRTDRITTPMGGGIIAVRPGAEADSVRRVLGASPVTWQDLVAQPGHQ